MKYTVVFEKAPRSYSAYVPDLPGCIAAGKTLEETKREIREAIAFHIWGMRQDGDSVPSPTTSAAEVEVSEDEIDSIRTSVVEHTLGPVKSKTLAAS